MKLFNEHAFDKITYNAAYFLGVLFSDGCTCITTNNRHTVSLGMYDKDTIKSFKTFMKSKNKISKVDKTYRISLCSEYLFWRLFKLGCVCRKSKILKKPLVKEKYLNAFILGLFDGDGSISLNKSINSWKASIGTASLSFFTWLKKVLKKLGIKFSVETRKIKNGLFYIICYTGVSAKELLKILYNNKAYAQCMRRKRDIFKKLKSAKFRKGPNLFEWELRYLRSRISNSHCFEKIKGDKRNYGWIRSVDSIRHIRKYHRIGPAYEY